jgi:hypothetical protein
MTDAQLQLLKYLWVGFRVTAASRSVLAPNGKVVTRVLDRTITECVAAHWIALDPTTGRYRLTEAGRQRVLVKERVKEFLNDLSNQQPA